MKKIIRLISVIITFGLLLFELTVLSNTLERKNSAEKYQDFFNEKQDFDVLFVGSSHMMNGVSPMDIWNDYGITSFNLGGSSYSVPTSYWVLRNALDYHTPKVVVIDGYLISSTYKISRNNYSSVHIGLDAFPLSRTKIEAVLDLLNDDKVEEGIANGEVTVEEERTPIGLLWDYSVYHSRWDELSESDFVVARTLNKGTEDKITIYPHEVPKSDGRVARDTVAIEYLDRLFEECEEREIEVIFTYLPSRDGYQDEANWICDYAAGKGVRSINFVSDDIVNPMYDFADEKGHLNLAGARKVSDYLARDIKEHVQIEDKRNTGDYESWNRDYAEYFDYKIAQLKAQSDVNLYFMLLCDTAVSCSIEASAEFIEKYGGIIDNISALGDVTMAESTDGMAYVEEIGAIPDAMVKVAYDDTLTDEIYIYEGNIYRSEQ